MIEKSKRIDRAERRIGSKVDRAIRRSDSEVELLALELVLERQAQRVREELGPGVDVDNLLDHDGEEEVDRG